MANQAAFTVNGTPSADANGDRIFYGLNGQTLTVQLEQNPSTALSARFQVYDPADPSSPFASKNAPTLAWVESGDPAIVVGPPPNGINDPVTITLPNVPAPPATGMYSYIIRCTASTAGDGSPGSQTQVFERLIVIGSLVSSPQIRKTVPAESTQGRARGTSDAFNDMADAIENLMAGAISISYIGSNAGQYAVPAAVAVGDLVYATGPNAADRADNGADTTIPCFGVVVGKPTATTATVAYMGQVAGFSGMTPGLEQYVGATGARVEAGGLPTTPGSVIQQVGIALSSTVMAFSPQNAVVL